MKYDGTSKSDWVVVYEGHDLHLSEGEYVQLHQAALNDPVGAERLALMHLARETSRPPRDAPVTHTGEIRNSSLP